VGETADDEIIERIKTMANTHHASMQLDQIRVYHIGRHYLVELEVVMPPQTTLLLVHDISLDLQKKVEQVNGPATRAYTTYMRFVVTYVLTF
jgi:divalent metal cation (Fe/Co/Zn/Cd) transporter